MKRLLFLLCAIFLSASLMAQNSGLTKEKIMEMDTEQLSDLSLEELMEAVEILGVSSVDEFFAMIMNKSVTSASKKEEDSFVSPLSSTVLTKEEIRMYGATTIEEAFKLIPGVIVQQKTNGVYDIQLRGLSNIPDNNMLLYAQSNNVLLMVDGRAAFNYTTGTMNIDHLPISIEDIDRIEVVRGASSALYGSNAVQGVINIITEKPNVDSNAVGGSWQIGSQNTNIVDLAFRTAVSGKLSLGATFNLQQRNRVTDKLYIHNNNGIIGLPNEVGSYVDFGMAPDKGSMPTISIANPVAPGYYSVAEINKMKYVDTSFGTVTDIMDPERGESFEDRFPDPDVARKTVGANGYVSIALAPEMNIDITGGYGQQRVADATLIDNIYTISYQQLKNSYINVAAKLKRLDIRGSYYDSSNEFQVGTPELKLKEKQLQAMVAYDHLFMIGDATLSFRPGVDFHWNNFSDYDNEFIRKFGGFLNSEATMKCITPSAKLDFGYENLRGIFAIRGDKTNMPDKWNISNMVSVSYKFNHKNFFRLSASRGMRSAVLMNTSTSYAWDRPSIPNRISFTGNPDAEIMHIDNFEIGYRARPTNSMIIDLEFFTSKSKNYGELMSTSSQMEMSSNQLIEGIGFYGNAAEGVSIPITSILQALEISSYVKYTEIPSEAIQRGVSFGMDWNMSKMLMAKVNLNWQSTKIDNYFVYNQAANISEQINAAPTSPENAVSMPGDTQLQFDKNSCMGRLFTFSHELVSVMKEVGSDLSNPTVQSAIQGVMKKLVDSGVFYLKEKSAQEFILGLKSDAYTYPAFENGHKHKATPSFYGSVGLYFHPDQTWNVATTLNFMSEREYQTVYGVEKLAPRCTVDMKVGYKPNNRVEVFFNARNLLNNQKREFSYADKIGGIYMAGVTFGL
ncbi:MAG: TonB-dependent receptor [Bacteroidales bacterium]|nr:TonB-dependent receptor [Bacteroidales bacterium]